ncbi:MAG: CooT family nickel-binding protein [Firmicutes bacterium]|nr:CooT family nickel-binding protein [Bacillota bacterium]MCL5038825.1 CooT family nickel-binding protein [Bacillota bacterium]
MCESNVYLKKKDDEELVMEAVDIIRPHDGELTLISIFGEERTIKGRITEMRLLEHKIFLEE